MTIKINVDRLAAGKFDIYRTDENGNYPSRIGFVTGAKRVYLAERGYETLGYFKTLKAAVVAIGTAYKAEQ